jgi:hypothetical protein
MVRLPASALSAKYPRIGILHLQRIKVWMRAHENSNQLEYEAFDAVLSIWLMGWVGILPTMILQLWWLLPLCVLALKTPSLYVAWRIAADAKGSLRCDWLALIAQR